LLKLPKGNIGAAFKSSITNLERTKRIIKITFKKGNCGICDIDFMNLFEEESTINLEDNRPASLEHNFFHSTQLVVLV